MGRSISSDSAKKLTKAVTSVDGFSTGDLIYQTPDKIGPLPDDFVSTGKFDATANQALYTTDRDTLCRSKLVFEPEDTATRNFGTGRPVATLSNGNIATVFYKNPSASSNSVATNQYKDVYMRIDQPDGTNVLPDTILNGATSTLRNYQNTCMEIVSSPSGGFAIAFSSASSQYMTFVVCQNDGTILGTQQYTTNNAYKIKIETFDELNRYGIVIVTNLDRPYLLIVDENGLISQQNPVSDIDWNGNIDICSLSDNTVALAYMDNNDNLNYRVYNSSAGLLVNETGVIPNQGSNGVYEVSCDSNSSDNVCIVLGGTTVGSRFQQVGKTDGKVIGGWGQLSALAEPLTNQRQYASNYCGNVPDTSYFLYTMHSEHESHTRVIDYQGAPISELLKNLITQNVQGAKALIKVGTELRYYASSGTQSTNFYHIQGSPLSIPQYTVLDSTNYLPDGQNSAELFAQSSSTDVLGYDRSTATPLTAKYFAKTSETTYGLSAPTTSASTLVKDVVSLDFKARLVRALELDNGNIAILYGTDVGGNTIFLKIVDSNYNELSNTELVTTNSFNGLYKIDLCRLNNGNIVVIYPSDSNYTILKGRVYNSEMVEQVAETQLPLPANLYGDEATICLCNIQISDQNVFGLAYTQVNGYSIFVICNSTDFAVQSSKLIYTGIVNYSASHHVVCDNNGYIFHSASYSSTGTYWPYRAYVREDLSIGTFAALSSSGNSNRGRRNVKAFLTSDGLPITPAQTSNADVALIITGTSPADYDTATSGALPQSNMGAIQSCSGNGKPFMFSLGAIAGLYGLDTFPDQTGYGYYLIGILMSGSADTTYGNVGFGFPSRGSKAHIISYDPETEKHSIFQIRLEEEPFSLSVVAGQSKSETIDLDSKRSVLLGVSVNDCAAGEAGIIQTEGNVSLSSEYPANTSESFDFETPTASGKKGSILGRTVTLGE